MCVRAGLVFTVSRVNRALSLMKMVNVVLWRRTGKKGTQSVPVLRVLQIILVTVFYAMMFLTDFLRVHLGKVMTIRMTPGGVVTPWVWTGIPGGPNLGCKMPCLLRFRFPPHRFRFS